MARGVDTSRMTCAAVTRWVAGVGACVAGATAAAAQVPKAGPGAGATNGGRSGGPAACDATRLGGGIRWTAPARLDPLGSIGSLIEYPQLVITSSAGDPGELMVLGANQTADIRRRDATPPAELGAAHAWTPITARDSVRHGARPYDVYHAPGFRVDESGTVRPLSWPPGVSRYSSVRGAAEGDVVHVVWPSGTGIEVESAPPDSMPTGAAPGQLVPLPTTADTIWYARLQGGSWSQPEPIWTGSGLYWLDYAPAALVLARDEIHVVARLSPQRGSPRMLYIHGRASRWARVELPIERTNAIYLTGAVTVDGSMLVPFVGGAFADSSGPNTNSVSILRASPDGRVRDQRVLYRSGWRQAHKVWASTDATGAVSVYWERDPPVDASNDGFKGGASASRQPEPRVISSAAPEIDGVVSRDGGETWERLAPLHVPGLAEAQYARAPDGHIWVIVRTSDPSGANNVVLAARNDGDRWSVWRLWSDAANPSLGVLTPGLTFGADRRARAVWSVVRSTPSGTSTRSARATSVAPRASRAAASEAPMYMLFTATRPCGHEAGTERGRPVLGNP